MALARQTPSRARRHRQRVARAPARRFGRPDGVTTAIARDVFGMPTSVTRSGLYAGLPVSATRSYVYDGFERLCKRIEPEAGGTLFEYDGVGNLTGSAEGQSSARNNRGRSQINSPKDALNKSVLVE